MTFAQLKRDLQVGKKLIMIFNSLRQTSKTIDSRIGQDRYIIRVQTNGVYLSEDKNAKRGSFLELPRASMVDYDGKTIKVYEPAFRELTAEEKTIIENMPSHRPENAEQSRIDMMTDGSTLFWKDKAYIKQLDAEWYWRETAGKYYIHGDKKMRDASIKGKVSIIYTLE